MGGWSASWGSKSYFRHNNHAGKIGQERYESMLSYYEKVSPQLMRARLLAGTAVYETRLACPEESKGTVVMPSLKLRQINVRGAPHR
jgi:hypothetical protein